jgi:hypothetical protein
VERAMRALGFISEAGEEEGGADAWFEDLRHPRRLRMGAGGLPVSVGPCSNAWALWANVTGTSADGSRVRVRRILTLRVEDAELPSEEAAVELLERITNAALFELGRESGVGLVPSRRSLPPSFPAAIGREGRGPLREPLVVRREYEARPMSLYWYAEEATEMPQQRHLGYYQVLEFYFPAYSVSAQLEAVRSKLSEIAPGGVRESDVEAILEAAGVSKKRMFPDERKQLMNVLKRCVEPDRLTSFLDSGEERARFYTSDDSFALSRIDLPPVGRQGGKGMDLRNRQAARVAGLLTQPRGRGVPRTSRRGGSRKFAPNLLPRNECRNARRTGFR